MTNIGVTIFIEPSGVLPETKGFWLKVKSTTSIEHVKDLVQNDVGLPPDLQQLIFEGTQLQDGHTLAEYNILTNSTLQLRLGSGVVTYDYAFSSAPPLGAEHLAHLASGSSIGQTVTGVTAGEYTIGFYSDGVVSFSVQFLDANGTALSVVSGSVTSEQMEPFALGCTAPAGSASASIVFATGESEAVFLDLVSFERV